MEFEFDVVHLMISLAVLLFALSFHESAHAWSADRLGDPTARLLGRVTLNPIPHLDFFMSFLMPAFMFLGSGGSMIFGGGKPVPVDPTRLRSSFKLMLVAAAGPASNVILVAVGLAIYMLVGRHVAPGTYGAMTLNEWCLTNLWLALFNLLPIPPLDGSKMLRYFLPGEWGRAYELLQYGNAGMVILLLFLYIGGTEIVLLPVMNGFVNFVHAHLGVSLV